MKAAVLEKIGAPLAVIDLDMSTHHDNKGGLVLLNPGQVLVKILCAGICGSQLQEIDGIKGDPAHLPHLLGHEGCGIVEQTGLGVTHVKRGDKVVMHWRRGVGMEIWGGTYGDIRSGPVTTFSTHSIVSENRVTKIDDDVPNDFAALLGCALSTALAIVENEANVKPETTVFVIGCGGLGLALILALKAAGVKNVIATDKCERKQRIVRDLGAQWIFNLAAGMDLVIDTVGCCSQLATNRYISLQKGGTEGGGFQPDKDIPRYVQMWRDGKLDGWEKIITHKIPLDGINRGISLMRQGKAGRVLIDFNQPCNHVPPCFEDSSTCWDYEAGKSRADALPNFP